MISVYNAIHIFSDLGRMTAIWSYCESHNDTNFKYYCHLQLRTWVVEYPYSSSIVRANNSSKVIYSLAFYVKILQVILPLLSKILITCCYE